MATLRGQGRHTQPNCYKWLATQQSNNMSGNQNQFPSSFIPLRDLLKAFMFPSNLNGFNSSPSPPYQGFAKWKGSSKVWKEKALSDLVTFSLSPFIVFGFALLVCFAFVFWVSLVLCIALFNMFLFVCFQFCLFCFSPKKNWKKKIQKQCMFYIHWYLCTLDGHWNKVF